MINKFMAKVTTWAMDKEGATAIEYGLIAAGISVAIVAVVFLLGDEIEGAFTTIQTELAAH